MPLSTQDIDQQIDDLLQALQPLHKQVDNDAAEFLICVMATEQAEDDKLLANTLAAEAVHVDNMLIAATIDAEERHEHNVYCDSG